MDGINDSLFRQQMTWDFELKDGGNGYGLTHGGHGLSIQAYVSHNELARLVQHQREFIHKPPVTQALMYSDGNEKGQSAILRVPGGIRVGDLLEYFNKMDRVAARPGQDLGFSIGVIIDHAPEYSPSSESDDDDESDEGDES
jgi:hypothetical protein